MERAGTSLGMDRSCGAASAKRRKEDNCRWTVPVARLRSKDTEEAGTAGTAGQRWQDRLEKGAAGAAKRRMAVWKDRAGGASALTGYRWRRGRDGHRFSVELQAEQISVELQAVQTSVELQLVQISVEL